MSKQTRGEAQAAPPEPAEIKSAKQHTRDLFTWLNQVVSDGELPSSAFKVAYIIGNYVNRASGDAWPSTARIALDCALSQSNVVAMKDRLKARGHLEIEPGSPGRGHSNHYRMILKHQPTDASVPAKHQPTNALVMPKHQPIDVSASPKASALHVESIRTAQIKHQLADMILTKNIPRNSQEAGRSRPAVLVDGPVTRSLTETRLASFDKLKRIYPPDRVCIESRAQEAFELALDAGLPLAELIEEAINFGAASRRGERVPFMRQWLLSKIARASTKSSALNAPLEMGVTPR